MPTLNFFVCQVLKIKRGEAFAVRNSKTSASNDNEVIITIIIMSIGHVCAYSPGLILWTIQASIGFLFPIEVYKFLADIGILLK